MRFLLPIIVGILSAFPAFSATVDLTVREQYGVARTNAPVTTGVPLPETGGITDVTKLRLLDGATPIDAQFKVLSRWGGKSTDTTKPIQWVLVDSQVSATANSNDVYTLEFGSSISTPSVTNPITHTEDSSEIVVDTGDAVFTVSKTAFNIIKQATVSGTSFLDSASEGAVILDSFGTKYFANNQVTSVAIEEDGPMRLVVVAKGFHEDDAATDANFYGYTTRIHFYKGKSTVRVVHTLENRPWTPRGALSFQDYSLEIDLSLASGTKNYMAYGATETTGTIGDSDKVYIYQDSDGERYWDGSVNSANDELHKHTTFRGYKIFKNSTELEQNNQALGVLDVSDSTKGVTAGIHQFWQRNPKKIMAEGDGTLTFGILPDDFDYMFFVEDMSMINTEVFLNFHTGAYTSGDRDEIVDRLHPLIFASPPSWYSQNTDDILPDNTLFYNVDGMTPRLLNTPYTYLTNDTVVHPLINTPYSIYDKRDEGLYSAITYGLRAISDRDGGNFEGPVNNFRNFMKTGQPGASGDTNWYYPAGRTDNPWFQDYDLFWGGVDFAQHWMYQRTTNLPEGWTLADAGIDSRADIVAYFYKKNYPELGGRLATDPVHTLATLTPVYGVQVSHQWFTMDYQHMVMNHIADYYHLTGDMAAIDYAHSAGEMYKTMLPYGGGKDALTDISADGTLDYPYTSFPQYFPMRGMAWPILALTTSYYLTDEDQYLTYAVEAGKNLLTTINSTFGYWQSDELMSIPQYSKGVMALASLYKLTSNAQYLTAATTVMDWLSDYVVNQTNLFLQGYTALRADGTTLTTYQDIVAYYDADHHQPANTLIRWQGGGSDGRLYYMFSWLYQKTGIAKYKNIVDANYLTANIVGWDVASASWSDLYLSQQVNGVPVDGEGPVCDINHLNLCNEGNCPVNWCTDVCQVEACSSPPVSGKPKWGNKLIHSVTTAE